MDPYYLEAKRLLDAIKPVNLLSFDSSTSILRLSQLNMLIGPNGSGKSNLIEAISLLRATANDLRSTIRRGGGIHEWIWKGSLEKEAMKEAMIEALIINPTGAYRLRHRFVFQAISQSFQLMAERIEKMDPAPREPWDNVYYRYEQGIAFINKDSQQNALPMDSLELDRSILSQLRDPIAYPEISYLAAVYEKIRIYREWSFGRNTIFREPQRADMRTDRLEEDFSNLGLVLNRLRRNAKAKSAILMALQDLYEGIDDFDVSVEGGTVQVFFTEGEFTIPATRLSDGTLRYLCLLAILCDPEPPPLICIEEPELGLHPDILPKVADLLRAAATRTQLIVTTHSDILVDAFTEQPETVLVCEKVNGRTHIRRLEQDNLQKWLKDYRLGELWTRGELGGTRW